VTSYLYSADNLQFYRDRVRWCLELAEASQSVPSIKIRLEALARKYQSWIDELERITPTSPPLAPDNNDKKSSASQLVDQFEEARSDSFMAA
jgi:hypothetical protein